MRNYGEAIGHFNYCLSNIKKGEIKNSIPDFHNTNKYYISLKKLIPSCLIKRKEIEKYFVFIQQFENKLKKVDDLIRSNKIPTRICHNDTKIDNILFKKKKVKSIIDLDTIMSTSIMYDFGDAIRTSCTSAEENEQDFNTIDFRLDLFKAFTKGYIKEVKCFISEQEVKMLGFAPILITIEQAIRFLSDYLNGNIYYSTNYPKENLHKTINQIYLAKKMLLKEEEMQSYINKEMYY